MPSPLPSSFSDFSQTHLSVFFHPVLLETDQEFHLERNTKLYTLLFKLFVLTQTFLKCQQHLQSYQENSWGWGQHHAKHVSLILQDEAASFASQHWLKSTLILLYQLPVSSSPTQFPYSL